MREQLNMFNPPENREPNSFYNTPGLKGKELIIAEKKATTKNARILQLFTDNPLNRYTPIEVSEILEIHESSCRRACHQLAKGENARLVRLAEQKMEKYFLPNHYYQLRQSLIQKAQNSLTR